MRSVSAILARVCSRLSDLFCSKANWKTMIFRIKTLITTIYFATLPISWFRHCFEGNKKLQTVLLRRYWDLPTQTQPTNTFIQCSALIPSVVLHNCSTQYINCLSGLFSVTLFKRFRQTQKSVVYIFLAFPLNGYERFSLVKSFSAAASSSGGSLLKSSIRLSQNHFNTGLAVSKS